MSPGQLAPDTVASIQQLATTGRPYQEIANTLGVSLSTVYRYAGTQHVDPVATVRDPYDKLRDLPGRSTNEPWTARALCAQTDPEAFFPDKGGSTKEAKAICNGTETRDPCPVRDDCLAHALATDERFGIAGGLSERERRKLKKSQPTLAPTGTDTAAPAVTVDQATTIDTPAPRQYGLPYVGGANGSDHYPLPDPDHVVKIEQRPKPQGIDWDAIRTQHQERRKAEGTLEDQPATTPVPVRCRWCRQPAEHLVDDLCQGCRDDAEHAFHVPDLPDLDIDPDDVDGLTDDPDHIPDLPTEGKQGKPTTGSSAPGATQASSSTRRARVAGPSTHRERDPEPARETRPTVGSGPLDVATYCEQLLRDTDGDTRPLVQILRGNALSALAALDLVVHPLDEQQTPPARVAAPAPQVPDHRSEVERRPGAATGPRPQPRRRAPRVTVDLDRAKQLLDQGHSVPQIARELGHSVATVRRHLKAAGVTIPDGRATHSGGRNQIKAYPAELVDGVRRLYVDQLLSQAQVAERLGTSVKVVQNVMARNDIPARAGECGHQDGAAPLKSRMADLGATSRDIKNWALSQGLISAIKRGIPKTELVDAYETAHGGRS